MDISRRSITKIARQAEALVIRVMRGTDIGSAELDLLMYARKHPGISQKEISLELGMDKGAVARRVKNLEEKGYLRREKNPNDGRGVLIYTLEKAEESKHTKAHVEAEFYEWLLSSLTEEERQAFAAVSRRLSEKAKEEREADFVHVLAILNAEKQEGAGSHEA